jgi:broad-specificity NMP kinase
VLFRATHAARLHAGPCADAAWEGALALDGDAEDALLDALEPDMAAGGVVLEHHTVDFFPERWFGRVLVLRCATDVLFDRLTARGYGARKIEENVCAEIMCVVAEEASDSYAAAVLRELPANTLADLEAAVASVEAWREDARAAAAQPLQRQEQQPPVAVRS